MSNLEKPIKLEAEIQWAFLNKKSEMSILTLRCSWMDFLIPSRTFSIMVFPFNGGLSPLPIRPLRWQSSDNGSVRWGHAPRCPSASHRRM